MRNYLDISVFISPGSDGNYQVRVSSNEGGQGHSTLKLPFRLGDLAGVLFGVEESTRGLASLSKPQVPTPTKTVEEFGVQLFDALFQGDCRDVLVKTEGKADDTSGCDGVRIRLSMDLRGPGMAQVASLPWELMRRQDQHPLALSNRTPLVRSLDVPQPSEPRPFQAPLRILAVMSNPKDTPPLNLQEERARIEKDWAQLPNVKVDFAAPTRSGLLNQLAATPYHVLHYMGHGDIGPTGEGLLLLEQGDGSRDPVSGDDFALILRDVPLRLVFLNACKSGMTSDAHPFAGVATSLIRARIPAVVAMQFPVSDQAAILFAQTFYMRIAQGLPVDAAVAEGRKQLYGSKHAEWATSVLYMRSKDGMLFGPAPAATPAPAAVAATPTPAADPNIFKVFLATTDQNLDKRQRELGKLLRALEWVRVLDFTLPDEPEEHASLIDKLMRQADLAIHLLGANPGQALDDDDPSDTIRTYPLEQLRIGLDVARSQMIVLSNEDSESIGNKKYQAKLAEITAMPREKQRLELVITEKNSITATILAKLQAMKDARIAALKRASADTSKGRTAFVDAHINDQEQAIDLVDFLEKRDVETQMRTSSASSPNSLANLDDTIRKSPLYIIVAGNVDKEWVINRRTAVQKSAVRSGAAILIAKYSALSEAGADETELMRARLKVVSALNDCDPSWIDDIFALGGGQ